MREIITLRERPTKESFSALLGATMDHDPKNAVGIYDIESGKIEVSKGEVNLLLDEDPDYADAVDIIRGFYNLRPIFDLRTPFYDRELRRLTRG